MRILVIREFCGRIAIAEKTGVRVLCVVNSGANFPGPT